jgi:V-type H+-transporting ATPase subunit F
MATSTAYKDRSLLAVIGDEVSLFFSLQPSPLLTLQDSVTGLLLAGIGHISDGQKKNFLVVDSSMQPPIPFLENER